MSPAKAEALRKHVHRTARRLGLWRPRCHEEEPTPRLERQWKPLDEPGCRRALPTRD